MRSLAVPLSQKRFLDDEVASDSSVSAAHRSMGLTSTSTKSGTACLRARSSCAPTDQTCICTDARLQQEVNDCVREKCTIREGLVTLNTTSTECGLPVQDKRQPLKTLAITLGAISPLFVILRMSARFMLMNQGGAAVAVGEDDWFILAALVVGVPNTVIIVSGLVDSGGLGLDIWRLDPETINSFGKYFYATAIMYFAEVTLLKMSLLWFYLRIFPSRGVRLALWATIAFNIAFGITFFLLGVLQCQPISYFWTKWDGEHEGTCVDINTVAWSNAGISIALDIWMLAVPLSQLQALRLNWKKKVGVALMFCVGTLVTVVSVLRLQSLVAFARAYGGGGGGGRTGATLGGTGGTSRIGTVSKAGSVTRPKDAELRGGITMQRTYNVSYSDPDDEESLVQMHDLEPRRRIDFEKPGSSASSVTIAPAADSWMSGGGRRSG
uniref:CFEM domain-containing protein n=1 Tax=Pyricularia oryzae (strain P131) TaxID=1143193 RepID=L7JBG9_PYRO1